MHMEEKKRVRQVTLVYFFLLFFFLLLHHSTNERWQQNKCSFLVPFFSSYNQSTSSIATELSKYLPSFSLSLVARTLALSLSLSFKKHIRTYSDQRTCWRNYVFLLTSRSTSIDWKRWEFYRCILSESMKWQQLSTENIRRGRRYHL